MFNNIPNEIILDVLKYLDISSLDKINESYGWESNPINWIHRLRNCSYYLIQRIYNYYKNLIIENKEKFLFDNNNRYVFEFINHINITKIRINTRQLGYFRIVTPIDFNIKIFIEIFEKIYDLKKNNYFLSCSINGININNN
jgi:hypothetical protein